jgi:hypothetical protein
MNTPESRPRISAVVPAYNEVECLPVLVTELRAALESTGRTWEMVLVDDGSGDGTGEAMLAEAARDPRIRVLRLERNAGQSAALAAGLLRAHGEVLVTMDADLQNDPADIPALLAALEHADVVSGVRATRRDDWVRRISSRVANGVRRVVLGDRITDIGCSLKAYRREVLEGLPMFVGVHRFPARAVRVPGLSCDRGASEPPPTHARGSASTAWGIGCGGASTTWSACRGSRSASCATASAASSPGASRWRGRGPARGPDCQGLRPGLPAPTVPSLPPDKEVHS